MSRLQTQYTCHHELVHIVTFVLYIRVRVAQMVRASHRQSEGYGFDSRQGLRSFFEIRLDTYNKLPHSQIHSTYVIT